jgi:hypothetical protein
VRVCASCAVGWPDPIEATRQVKTRHYADNEQAAADWIANLAKFPRHHRLLAVHRCTLPRSHDDCDHGAGDWAEISVDDLPAPRATEEETVNADA